MNRAKGISARAFMACYSSPPRSPYNAAPITPMAYARPIGEISAEHATVNEEGDCAAWCAACRDGYSNVRPLRSDDAITAAFDRARETIAEIETARDCWSVAQAVHYRRVA